MNRLVVNHFFEERILEESSYPKKQEKHALALKILEAFPQLEKTRVTPDAPKESYFFWICGGKDKGPHTGLIETRTANMRKEVPPEQRRYQRKEKGTVVNYILPDSIREHATTIASLEPLPSNEEAISNGMNECIDLHSCILQQGDSDLTEALVSTFPHLLSYRGKMVQQIFQRLHTYYESTARSDKFLLLGLLIDTKSFNNVENKYIRATLRILKKLTVSGKKNESGESSSEEAEAAPLIRWIKPKEGEQDVQAVQRHVSALSYLAPHIVCVADVFKKGDMFVVFQGKYIACGKSAAHTLDVFFKIFAVFGIPVPVLLRKIHELLMVYLWKVTSTCKSVAVTKLMGKLKELEMSNDEDDYEDADDLS
ncbi:AAEL003987-PA [Aedes aegypti]|nr:AAEL003987-PA [Aedes aegypti]